MKIFKIFKKIEIINSLIFEMTKLIRKNRNNFWKKIDKIENTLNYSIVNI